MDDFDLFVKSSYCDEHFTGDCVDEVNGNCYIALLTENTKVMRRVLTDMAVDEVEYDFQSE